jgi:glutaconate CoA-transferase subunit B
MVVALAREIVDGDLVGVGLGTPLALAAALLAKAAHAPDAHVLAGGALDAKADLPVYMGGSRNLVGRAPGWVSHFDSMDMAERHRMTLQILRPAQVDGSGNLNTSRIGGLDRPKLRFPGGLATADVPQILPRLAVYLPAHRARSLPEQVAFVTGRGGGWPGPLHPSRGVVLAVTDLATIRFEPAGPRLASVHHWADIDRVVAETGFTMDTSDVSVTPSPTQVELDVLAELDPEAMREREIPATVGGGTT